MELGLLLENFLEAILAVVLKKEVSVCILNGQVSVNIEGQQYLLK